MALMCKYLDSLFFTRISNIERKKKERRLYLILSNAELAANEKKTILVIVFIRISMHVCQTIFGIMRLLLTKITISLFSLNLSVCSWLTQVNNHFKHFKINFFPLNSFSLKFAKQWILLKKKKIITNNLISRSIFDREKSTF